MGFGFLISIICSYIFFSPPFYIHSSTQSIPPKKNCVMKWWRTDFWVYGYKTCRYLSKINSNIKYILGITDNNFGHPRVAIFNSQYSHDPSRLRHVVCYPDISFFIYCMCTYYRLPQNQRNCKSLKKKSVLQGNHYSLSCVLHYSLLSSQRIWKIHVFKLGEKLSENLLLKEKFFFSFVVFFFFFVLSFIYILGADDIVGI